MSSIEFDEITRTYRKNLLKWVLRYALLGVVLAYVPLESLGNAALREGDLLPVFRLVRGYAANPGQWAAWYLIMWLAMGGLLIKAIAAFPYSYGARMGQIIPIPRHVGVLAGAILLSGMFYFIAFDPVVVPAPNIRLGHAQLYIALSYSSVVGLSLFGTLVMVFSAIAWLATLVLFLTFLARVVRIKFKE